jgi:hypothetical protein
LRHLHLTAAFNLFRKNAKIITPVIIASIHGIGGHPVNIHWSRDLLTQLRAVNIYRFWWTRIGKTINYNY